MKKLIQMKLSENTIDQVTELKALLKEDNRTQIVAEGIAIYLQLAKAFQSGAKLILENTDGTRDRLLLTR
jgi:hypothetical protein